MLYVFEFWVHVVYNLSSLLFLTYIMKRGIMFDLSKLGDMSKLAQQAKDMQAQQERVQNEQSELLKKMSGQLDEIVTMLKENRG